MKKKKGISYKLLRTYSHRMHIDAPLEPLGKLYKSSDGRLVFMGWYNEPEKTLDESLEKG